MNIEFTKSQYIIFSAACILICTFLGILIGTFISFIKLSINEKKYAIEDYNEMKIHILSKSILKIKCDENKIQITANTENKRCIELTKQTIKNLLEISDNQITLKDLYFAIEIENVQIDQIKNENLKNTIQHNKADSNNYEIFTKTMRDENGKTNLDRYKEINKNGNDFLPLVTFESIKDEKTNKEIAQYAVYNKPRTYFDNYMRDKYNNLTQEQKDQFNINYKICYEITKEINANCEKKINDLKRDKFAGPKLLLKSIKDYFLKEKTS